MLHEEDSLYRKTKVATLKAFLQGPHGNIVLGSTLMLSVQKASRSKNTEENGKNKTEIKGVRNSKLPAANPVHMYYNMNLVQTLPPNDKHYLRKCNTLDPN